MNQTVEESTQQGFDSSRGFDGRSDDEATRGGRVIALGAVRIDTDAYRVHVGEQEIPLTGMEFKLLLTLAERRDRVMERGQLLADVWRVKSSNATRTVDTHVKRLRDKLGTAGHIIQTVRGIGYRLSEAPSVQDIDGRCSGRDRAPVDAEGNAHRFAAAAGRR